MISLFFVIFVRSEISSDFIDELRKVRDIKNNNNLTWNPVEVTHRTPSLKLNPLASSFIKQTVYIALTTISQRINTVADTVLSLLNGILTPDHIFVVISRKAYLIDEGIQKIPSNLLKITRKYPVTIVYTDNIGPHRKLLPLLKQKWNEDCVIVTFDDDLGRFAPSTLLSNLIKYYIASGRESVVALRTRRIGICDEKFTVSHYSSWLNLASYGAKEMLVLPIGTGGVLYRPKFFSEIVFDQKLRSHTETGDDLMFRFATMIKNTFVVTACSDIFNKKKQLRKCPSYIPVFPNITNSEEAKQNLLTLSCALEPKLCERKVYFSANQSKNEEAEGADLDLIHLTLEEELNNSSFFVADHTPYRRLRADTKLAKSLYAVNRVKTRNNIQWSAGSRYLWRLGLLDTTKLVTTYLSTERPNCVSKRKNSQKCCIYHPSSSRCRYA